MAVLTVFIDGIGIWTPGITGWDAMRRAIDGDAIEASGAPSRPAPTVLPPTERRRAPEPVLLACEAASQACAMAARDAALLACVFASTHGDLAITDAMCATLAADPRELSPTRFHNSVHNAPAGYWTVATRCHRAATAISAAGGTFAAGLIEAAGEVATEGEPVLFCAYDIAAQGPLAEVAPSALPFAIAMVLAPSRSARSRSALLLRLSAAEPTSAPIPSSISMLAANPIAAQALPLLVAMAHAPARTTLARARATSLDVEVMR